MSLPPAEKAASDDAAAPPAATEDAARTAGRGGIAIAGAKVSFIVFGFAQQLILPVLIGLTGYGQVSRVLAIVSIVNNVIVATAIQGVSRAVASVPVAAADQAFRRTLRIHGILAAVVASGFAALAGPIASAVGAEHITTPLRLASGVVLLYGLYAPLVGSLNGRKRFVQQAGLDVSYGAIRLFAMVSGALLLTRLAEGSDHVEESGVVGAIVGFVIAAAIIVPVALAATGLGKSGPHGPSVREHLAFLAPLAMGQVFLNLLMQTDFMLLSRFLGESAAATGQGTDATDSLIAAYRGAQLFSFLPYQLLISITFVLFPMLARAYAEGDAASVKRFTASGVRLAFVLTGLMCGVVASLAPHVLRLAFPIEVSENGGDALRILSLGMGSFAVLGIVSSALTSLRRERLSFAITAVTVALVAAGCVALVPGADFGPEMLVKSAIATACALTVAAIVGGFVLRSVAGAFVSPITVVRVVSATAATVALGSQMPWLGKPMVVIEAAAMAVFYVVVLVVLREVGGADLAQIRGALGRKRAA